MPAKKKRGKVKISMTLQERWSAFTTKEKLAERAFLVIENFVKCSLCDVKFSADDDVTTVKYARDHHKRVASHQILYAAYVDDPKRSIKDETDAAYDMVIGNYGRGQFERSGKDKILCKCGSLLSLIPKTGDVLNNIIQHRKSSNCQKIVGSSLRQSSLFSFIPQQQQ